MLSTANLPAVTHARTVAHFALSATSSVLDGGAPQPFLPRRVSRLGRRWPARPGIRRGRSRRRSPS
ncbi:hypothetical protein JOE30_003780 [Rhodococcus sp. PvP016]|uniref:Uncharacterized protein n=1 Tax=Rhodococcoides corynebacterioides TaxID=53972 RepID=A0ABS2KUN1_9NOCA|nr:hypothetical protein [Rhodococcus corynebacterioides]MBP1117983.1 hypothetical protein [Rhodococcus sp. PvP016]